MNARTFRHGLLLIVSLLAITFSGCGGVGSVTQQPSAPPSPTILFSDEFNGAFPGTNWTIVRLPVAIDPNIGNLAPSLRLGPRLGDSSGQVQSVRAFSSADGVTFLFDVGSPTFTGALGQVSQLAIHIFDQNRGVGLTGLFGVMVITVAFGGPGSMHVSIRDGTIVERIVPFNIDLDFHRFVFRIDSSRNAAWFRDAVQLVSFSGFSAGNFVIQFTSQLGSTVPTFVDNVFVTKP